MQNQTVETLKSIQKADKAKKKRKVITRKTLLKKSDPENRKQDRQFMTLFPGFQIRYNANAITHNSPTQPKAVINKKISKSQQGFCEDVRRQRRARYLAREELLFSY
ncbi:Hypothetical_protein [Hexamita inflata]|uniref:Hypothetical_protein n=1 Tax=Hexamita inflata TaxID=28002 RepID=A0AA86RD54_9EUKA|nr:Hypothetical protein HINF_LOCUS58612 [Hexamita inflata]